MIRKLLYMLLLLSLGSACQEEEASVFPAEGTLSVSSLSLHSLSRRPLSTRAVASDLAVDILGSDGQCVKAFPAGSADWQQKIPLPVGSYTLRAYTESYAEQDSWTDADKGAPVYVAEASFLIEEDKTTRLSLEVPMTNYGVALSLPEGFGDWFTVYTFRVQAGGRTVELRDGETAYFPLQADGASAFTYSLSATNTDGEEMAGAAKTFADGIAAGTVYEVTWSLAARSLRLR